MKKSLFSRTYRLITYCICIIVLPVSFIIVKASPDQGGRSLEEKRAIWNDSLSLINDLNTLAGAPPDAPVEPPSGWKYITTLSSKRSSLSARVFTNASGLTVIAFPGTTNPVQWAQNYDSAVLGNISPNLIDAILITARVLRDISPTKGIIVTGFSKGGMEAEFVSSAMGIPGVAFSSPGIPVCSMADMRDRLAGTDAEYFIQGKANPETLVINKDKDPFLLLFKKPLQHLGSVVTVAALPNETTIGGVSDHADPRSPLYNLSPSNKAEIVTFLTGEDGPAILAAIKDDTASSIYFSEISSSRSAVTNHAPAFNEPPIPNLASRSKARPEAPAGQQPIGRWEQIKDQPKKHFSPIGTWQSDTEDFLCRCKEVEEQGYTLGAVGHFVGRQYTFNKDMTYKSKQAGTPGEDTGTFRIKDPELGILIVTPESGWGSLEVKIEGDDMFISIPIAKKGSNARPQERDYFHFRRAPKLD